MDIGKPVRRITVIPLTEPVPPTHEPPPKEPVHAPRPREPVTDHADIIS